MGAATLINSKNKRAKLLCYFDEESDINKYYCRKYGNGIYAILSLYDSENDYAKEYKIICLIQKDTDEISFLLDECKVIGLGIIKSIEVVI